MTDVTVLGLVGGAPDAKHVPRGRRRDLEHSLGHREDPAAESRGTRLRTRPQAEPVASNW